jgi:YihY family inner membrane protein
MAKQGAPNDSKVGLIPSVVAAIAVTRSARRAPTAEDVAAIHAGDRPSLAEVATVEEPSGGVKRFVWRLDRYQRDRPAIAFPLAVGKKFTEDKAGFLAALVAYFGFFSVFPLMLAFMSVLGFVLPDPDDQREFADAAANQIPVVGGKIQQTAGALDGSVVAIVIPLIVALWSGLKIVDAMQNALNDVWDLPPINRPSMITKRLRGFLMLGLIGGGLVGSVALSNIATLLDVIPGVGKFGIWGASLAMSIGLYLLSFQLLTDMKLPWRDLVPGAVFGGTCWWLLQTFGSPIIIRQQESAGEAYGDFATIIALLVFLFIAAQLSLLGAEISVVRSRGLWPRSLVKGDFTEADIEAFELLASSTRQDARYEVRLEPAAGRGPG